MYVVRAQDIKREMKGEMFTKRWGMNDGRELLRELKWGFHAIMFPYPPTHHVSIPTTYA